MVTYYYYSVVLSVSAVQKVWSPAHQSTFLVCVFVFVFVFDDIDDDV